MARTSLFVIALIVGWTPVSAIINSMVPLGNTTAPTGTGGEPTDPGFDYVGQVNGSTGVYLGNGWVLTANHVNAGNFTLDGLTYSYNGVDSHQIGGVDLRLFKLSTNPMLTPLTLASTSPSINDEVVMIGAGRSPVSNSTTRWYADVDPVDPDPWIWDTTVFAGADYYFDGYETSSIKTKRWGTNMIEDVFFGGGMHLVSTDFDAFGGTTFESQAVYNDSGSGLFVESGSGWELAGTIVTVGNFPNQPGGSTSALFGNITYAVDLSYYASEINGYLLSPVPELANSSLLFGCFTLLFCIFRKRAHTVKN